MLQFTPSAGGDQHFPSTAWSARPHGMNRAGLLIAIGAGIVAGLILGIFPSVDLALSRRFFDPAAKAFLLARDETALAARDGFVYVITAIAVPAFIALVVKLILPRRP